MDCDVLAGVNTDSECETDPGVQLSAIDAQAQAVIRALEVNLKVATSLSAAWETFAAFCRQHDVLPATLDDIGEELVVLYVRRLCSELCDDTALTGALAALRMLLIGAGQSRAVLAALTLRTRRVRRANRANGKYQYERRRTGETPRTPPARAHDSEALTTR